MRRATYCFAALIGLWAVTAGAQQMDLNSLLERQQQRPAQGQPYRPTQPTGAYYGGRAPAQWTFMVYIAADNNLDGAGKLDIDEMEEVGSSNDVKIVVYYDRQKEWATARRALIQYKPGAGAQSLDPSLPTCDDLGASDSGDPQTLRNFVQWAKQNHPAQRYALVLWNHGGGWRDLAQWQRLSRMRGYRAGLREICSDDSSNSVMYNSDVRKALEQTGVKFDLLCMDACLMGMLEVGYEFRNLAPYMVFSAQSIPGKGYDYEPFLRSLKANPSMGPDQLGRGIVQSYQAEYQNFSAWPTTLALVDTARVTQLTRAMDEFVRQSASVRAARAGGPFAPVVQSSRVIADGKSYVDLGTFLTQAQNQAQLGGGVQNAARAALNVYDTCILSKFVQPNGGTGMSIFLPESSYATSYNDYTAANSLFAQDSLWPLFVKGYAEQKPIVIPGGGGGQGGGNQGGGWPGIINTGGGQQGGQGGQGGGQGGILNAATPIAQIYQMLLTANPQGLQPVGVIQANQQYFLKIRSRTGGARPGLKETLVIAVFDQYGQVIPTSLRFRSFRFTTGDFVYTFSFQAPSNMNVFKVRAMQMVSDQTTDLIEYQASFDWGFQVGGSGAGFVARSTTPAPQARSSRQATEGGVEAVEATKSATAGGGDGGASAWGAPVSGGQYDPNAEKQPGSSALDKYFK